MAATAVGNQPSWRHDAAKAAGNVLRNSREADSPHREAMSINDTDGAVKQRSGWLIPITVFVVTAGLSALVLLFYLAPTPTSFIEEHAAPTSRTDLVALSVNGMNFTIPANYILYARARQGGAMQKVELFTALPDFQGYSDWHSSEFSGNAADSPVIFLLLRNAESDLSEENRLQRVYMSYLTDPAGKPGPFGLTQYTFREDSGYHNEDLFAGQQNGKTILLRCVRFSAEVSSPSCLREMPLGHGVVLTYRFKRANLGRWQEIASGVDKLLASFRTK